MRIIVALLLLSTTVLAQVANTTIEMATSEDLKNDSLKAIYHEDFAEDKSISEVLFGALSEGEDGAWQNKLINGKYRMSNSTDETAVRYFWLGNIPNITKSLAGKAVSVTVSGDFADNLSAAGLIYRFDSDTKNYFAFTIENGTNYAFYVRDDNGLRRPIVGQSLYIQPDTNVLTVVPNGEKMELFINNHSVGGLSSAEIKGTAVGIFAAGIGEFLFDDFAVYEVNQQAFDRAPNSHTKIYSNLAQGYSVDYPDGWTVLAKGENKPVTIAKDEDSLMLIMPLKDVANKEQGFVERSLAMFDKIYEGLEINSITDSSLLNVPIKIIDISFLNKGVKTSGRWFVPVEVSENGFMIMYGSPETEFDQEKAEFERILASFSLSR
ncbi:MAG TPA: hypothetical protein ENK21_00815 [Trueperaceae bacterium]|nr:hypothetical protein [Trueperaceae bacterium]